MRTYDVGVMGGGPAGAATALALAHSGRSVILIERSDYANYRPGETLAPESGDLLERLGVWGRFLALEPRPLGGIWSAWGGPGLVAKDFILSPHGPGWQIDRQRFDRMLLAAAENAGVHVESDVGSVNAARRRGTWELLAGRNGWTVRATARFLVDATGRAAAVARTAGVRWRSVKRQVALVGLFQTRTDDPAEDEVLLVEAVPDGWWYSSLLPNQTLVAAYITDLDPDRKGRRAPARLWAQALITSEYTRKRLGNRARRGFHVCNAAPGRLDRAAGVDWIAVGDAASAFDPLSGLGLTKALRGAMAAANAVHGCLAGQTGALEGYAEAVAAEFAESLRSSAVYYGSERRWPNSPFWRGVRATV